MEKDTKWFLGILAVFFVIMCCLSSRAGTTKDYTVQPGDSWYSIAEEQGVDIDELLRVNGATKETMLYPDQVIKIPVSHNSNDSNSSENEADEVSKPEWMEQNSQ